ncbi:hypothetical protein EZ313_03045 [Ramlibacter henchirensis]|uniref:STAS/SEC14 domain-containing protein n=1 Tax=Ramlibacter henchirensis TaxID=204072 RepID=A0A4Z0C6G2_9BURK|nr:STAS/SEC14 domain-containing protein [Ramlibacter henchirensis]TFZ05655.1 hypothetical protein EZ313_03045 [Ramlibacter henchirensis]
MFCVAIQEDSSHIKAVASGRANLADLCGMADLVARVASMNGHRRALFDLLAVEPDITFSEHLNFGVHFASALKQLERVASVVSERERKGTSEKTAQKQGLNFRTFTDVDQARDWLHI